MGFGLMRFYHPKRHSGQRANTRTMRRLKYAYSILYTLIAEYNREPPRPVDVGEFTLLEHAILRF